MMVKVCGITNPEDALAALEAGAAAVGLNFYAGSPRRVTLELAEKILEVVPASFSKVGVFVNQDCGEIALRLGLDAVQLHGGATGPAGLRIWRAVSVGNGFDAAGLDPAAADAYLLDAPCGTRYGGMGRAFDWKLARGAPVKVIIAGGLDESNVARAIEDARPWGVDACSRLESSPGKKDHRKMAAFIKAALEAL